MSHFAVIVIGDDVESALRPFQENNMGDCPAEFLKFHDETEEIANGWATLSAADRAKYESIAKYAVDYYGYRERRAVDVAAEGHARWCDRVQDHTQQAECSCVERFGYLENPNKKWDYWTIGGRYAGWLPTAKGDVDSALKSEIDWTPRRDAREARYRGLFSRWKQALDAHPDAPRPLSWRDILAKHTVAGIDAARAEYNAQLQIATWKKIAEAHDRWETFDLEPVAELGFDIDALVARERRRAPVPFAFLRDGEWHERGRMGWWAVVHNEKEVDGWCAEWERTWDALPPDARLTCVDCHI